MNFQVRIKPVYRSRFVHLPIDVTENFDVLVSSEHDTFIVWQSWPDHRQCFVLRREEVDIV